MNKEFLSRKCRVRLEKMFGRPHKEFTKKQVSQAKQIYDSLIYAENEKDSLGMIHGLILTERNSHQEINTALDTLKADPIFSDLEDEDLLSLIRYLDSNHGFSLTLAPDFLSSFFKFCQGVGFPCTYAAAKKGELSAPRYSTQTMLNVLVGSKVLSLESLRAKEVKKYVKHTEDEDQEYLDQPLSDIDFYELDSEFKEKFEYLLKKMKIKNEDYHIQFQEEKEDEMKALERLRKLEERLKRISIMEEEEREESLELNGEIEPQERSASVPFFEEEEDESHDEKVDEFFHHISDEMLDEFIDGVLLVLGQLEQTGEIPSFESAKDAKAAVIAVVQKLYQKKGLIGKMSSKYYRYGAKRELRKAKSNINKALS